LVAAQDAPTDAAVADRRETCSEASAMAIML